MLKPHQLRAIDLLVAGTTIKSVAREVHVDRATIRRWKNNPEFHSELNAQTRDATEDARRFVGSEARAAMFASQLATEYLTGVVADPKAPGWMRSQAAMSIKKDARHAAQKLDPEFRSMEAIGRLDMHQQCIANGLTHKIAVWENRDRLLSELQEYEERRLQTRCEQRQQKMWRRFNMLLRHGPENRAYLYGVWRRDDDQDEAFEMIRREKARREFAAAAEVDLKDLPPIVPFKWADLNEEFENLVAAKKAPASEAEALAEHKRVSELEDLDPNSPEGKAYQEKFDAKLKEVEADYRARIMPKVQPSPIKREARETKREARETKRETRETRRDAGSAGVPRPPASPSSSASETAEQPEEGRARDARAPSAQKEAAAPPKKKAGRVVNGKWRGPIPDEGTPEHDAYLNALPDDAVPELSESDRAHREDFARRGIASEARERQHMKDSA